MMKNSGNFKPLIVAGLLLGIGFGALAVSIILPRDRIIFISSWIISLLGVVYLWNISGRIDVPHSSKGFYGSLLIGLGLFCFVDGVLVHHLLKLHHVMESASNPERLYYDLAYLFFAIFLILIGRVFIKSAKKDFKLFEFSEPISERLFS